MKPQRIQLSRKRGFNLQKFSLALNGLPAVNCARPSKWGNPFKIGAASWFSKTLTEKAGVKWDGHPLTREESIAIFKVFLIDHPSSPLRNIEELKNSNVACFCKKNEKCHADCYLEILRDKNLALV